MNLRYDASMMDRHEADKRMDAAYRRLAEEYPDSFPALPEEDEKDFARFPGPDWVRAAGQALVVVGWRMSHWMRQKPSGD